MSPDNPQLKSKTVNRLYDGVQHVYEFYNGFGVSAVKHKRSIGGSQGLWEAALLKDGDIYYTEEFSDVVGNLNDPELDRILQKVARF